MSKNINKSGIIITTVIVLVILALLNICTFVIPFNKSNLLVHYISYGCSEFVILVEFVLVVLQLFLEENKNQRIIALPIVFFGYLTIVIQIFFTFLFYLINGFVSMPLWLVIVIESIVFAFGIIQVARGFFFKTRNALYHEQTAKTKFMDEFRARLKALNKINKNSDIEKELTDLLDTALASDPVSNDKTLDSESELLSLLQELDEVVKGGDTAECRNVIEKTKNTLIERNVLCKAGK